LAGVCQYGGVIQTHIINEDAIILLKFPSFWVMKKIKTPFLKFRHHKGVNPKEENTEEVEFCQTEKNRKEENKTVTLKANQLVD
jgi:hypothetical protein